jgi:hypothetical protein
MHHQKVHYDANASNNTNAASIQNLECRMQKPDWSYKSAALEKVHATPRNAERGRKQQVQVRKGINIATWIRRVGRGVVEVITPGNRNLPVGKGTGAGVRTGKDGEERTPKLEELEKWEIGWMGEYNTITTITITITSGERWEMGDGRLATLGRGACPQGRNEQHQRSYEHLQATR